MDAEDQNLIKPDEFEIKDKRFFQIDFIKAMMIFLVIFDHTIPWAIKSDMGVILWERISIPVFLVIMGFNMGLSFQRNGETTLKKLYSWNYFKKKFWRYIYPFIILYIASSLIGFMLNGIEAFSQYEGHYAPEHLILGILPFWGPGNWFLPVIFISILIVPLLYKFFSGKWRILALMLCYLIELATYLYLYFGFYQDPFTSLSNYNAWLFNRVTIAIIPFSMLSAIGLGLWLSRNPNIFAKQNILIWILAPLSLIYLIAYGFYDYRISFMAGDYHLFIFPYSAFLVLLGIKLIPKRWNNWFTKAISTIGKSTYHILLTQILYFSVVYSVYGDHYGASILGINMSYDLTIYLYLIINWVICIPCGVFWYYIDFKLRDYYLLHKKNKYREEEEV